MTTTRIHTSVFVVALTVVSALRSSATATAQFVGGNPMGAMVLSPLGETSSKKGAPVKSAKQRRLERLTAERLKRLKSVNRRLSSARSAADTAAAATEDSAKVRYWGAAVRRAKSAWRRLDRLRTNYRADKAFMAQADRLAFAVRLDLSAFKRQLKKLEAARAKTAAAAKAAAGAADPTRPAAERVEPATDRSRSADRAARRRRPASRPSRL